MLGRGRLRFLALGGEEGEELGQVPRIGLDGVGGGTSLRHQHVDEERKLRGARPAR